VRQASKDLYYTSVTSSLSRHQTAFALLGLLLGMHVATYRIYTLEHI